MIFVILTENVAFQNFPVVFSMYSGVVTAGAQLYVTKHVVVLCHYLARIFSYLNEKIFLFYTYCIAL